jgi:DNA gyrase/topoisomerase IV subunit B
VCDLKRDAIYKNDELYNLMRSLNIEETVDGLRYQKVILATDADVDGLHIRNLLITFFLRFFEPLVREGHLLHPGDAAVPRAQQEGDPIYCYSEAERDAADQALGGARDHPLQGPGRDLAPASSRPSSAGHAADPGGGGRPAPGPGAAGVLHGQATPRSAATTS